MSLFSWRYEGADGERASKDSGVQRVKAGDEVYDDELRAAEVRGARRAAGMQGGRFRDLSYKIPITRTAL